MVSLKAAVTALLFSAGVCSAQDTDNPYKIVTTPDTYVESMSITNKEQIDCKWIAQRDPIVIFGAGQSLIGNSNGSVRWDQRINRNIYEHWGTRCYKASEPIYGGADVHRSFIYQLANLISRATNRDVVINLAAVGGADIERFKPGADVHRIVIDQLQNAKSVGLIPTAIIWEHGQANVTSDQQQYKQAVEALFREIREQGINAPIFVAQDTMLSWQNYPVMRKTQSELASEPGNVIGPNIDLILFRSDGTHMDDEGIEVQAAMWFQTIAAYFKW